MHQRTVSSKTSLKNLPGHIKRRDGGHRLRYLYPLTKQIRKQIEKLRKPYPKKEDLASMV